MAHSATNASAKGLRVGNMVEVRGAGSRCDGTAHGGCQTACLLYWKEAWLKRRGTGRDEFADRWPHRSAVAGNQHT